MTNIKICYKCERNEAEYAFNDGQALCGSCWFILALEFRDSRIRNLEMELESQQLLNSILWDSVNKRIEQDAVFDSLLLPPMDQEQRMVIVENLEDEVNKRYFKKLFKKFPNIKSKGGDSHYGRKATKTRNRSRRKVSRN